MGPGAPSMMHPAQPMVPPQQYTVRPPAVPQVGVTTVGILYPQKLYWMFLLTFLSQCLGVYASSVARIIGKHLTSVSKTVN